MHAREILFNKQCNYFDYQAKKPDNLAGSRMRATNNSNYNLEQQDKPPALPANTPIDP